MEVGADNLIQGVITVLAGAGLGFYKARNKKQSDNMSAATRQDEVVLVHYDKIVDQLQEEVVRLTKQNAELSKANHHLERSVLNLNRQVMDLSRQVEELKTSLGLLKALGNTPKQ